MWEARSEAGSGLLAGTDPRAVADPAIQEGPGSGWFRRATVEYSADMVQEGVGSQSPLPLQSFGPSLNVPFSL